MERYWEQSIFKYLRAEPEDHYFLLTEVSLNPPKNREPTAEIFESFNIKGLYIAVQAALASASPREPKTTTDRGPTGTVVDSGDSVTHVIPFADGYVIAVAGPAEEDGIRIGIREHLDNKLGYKHLDGGVEFVDSIPKNPSGKLLPCGLRDKAKEILAEGRSPGGTKAKL